MGKRIAKRHRLSSARAETFYQKEFDVYYESLKEKYPEAIARSLQSIADEIDAKVLKNSRNEFSNVN